MTMVQIIEIAIGAALLALGVLQYRKRAADGARYGSQSAMLLFVAAALLIIHGLGLTGGRVRDGWLS